MSIQEDTLEDSWQVREPPQMVIPGSAKEKNLTAILGLGASPGITNLLGKIAIDHFCVKVKIGDFYGKKAISSYNTKSAIII